MSNSPVEVAEGEPDGICAWPLCSCANVSRVPLCTQPNGRGAFPKPSPVAEGEPDADAEHCMCGQRMDTHDNGMESGHAPVSMKDYYSMEKEKMAEGEPDGWRPIETAPKDTEIIAYGEWCGEVSRPSGEKKTAVVKWTDRSDHEGFNWDVTASDGYAAWLKAERWMPLAAPSPGMASETEENLRWALDQCKARIAERDDLRAENARLRDLLREAKPFVWHSPYDTSNLLAEIDRELEGRE